MVYTHTRGVTLTGIWGGKEFAGKRQKAKEKGKDDGEIRDTKI